MITFKQFTQWQGQYCCVKTGNLEIITTDKHLGVLCQCKACFSAEFYDPRILEEYAGNKNGAGVVGGKREEGFHVILRNKGLKIDGEDVGESE